MAHVNLCLVGRLCAALMIAASFGCEPGPPAAPAASRTHAESGTKLESTSTVQAMPLPALPASEFLNTGANGKYVGSDSCRECHPEQTASFLATKHSRSMTTANEVNLEDAAVTHAAAGYVYRSRQTAGKLTHTESIIVNGTEQVERSFPIAVTVGSGEFGHSFLTEVDGFLMQSPLTWYSTRKCWDLSPGYDSPEQMSFRRTISARCFYCHAGITKTEDANEYKVRIVEEAIGCERCHGPGSVHVARHHPTIGAVSGSGIDYSIVNPRHLPRDLQESVCQQCHLQSATHVLVRGQKFDSYRPGMPLTAFRRDFALSLSGKMTVVGHVEQLHGSACYQRSETLSCTTCHDPHGKFSEEQRQIHYRKACLSCHAESACKELPTVRAERQQDRCVSCHMPASPTEVPHVAFTHHRIGLHSSVSGSETHDEIPKLVSLLKAEKLSDADQARLDGLAWLNLALNSSDVSFEASAESARQSLQTAWDGGAGDADVAAGMARIAFEIGRSDMVELWAGRALALDKSPSDARTSALLVLSEVQYSRHEFRSAFDSLEELTRVRRDARQWLFRGMTEQKLGKTDDAIRSLQKSLTINPRNPGAHVALTEVYLTRKDFAAVRYHEDMARQLMPKGQ